MLQKVVTTLLFVLVLSHNVLGQTLPQARLVVNANLGMQIQSSSRTDSVQFDLNRELGSLQATQTLGPYSVLDLGTTTRLWKGLGFGFAFSRAQGQSTASVESEIPHPLFFDFHRTATTSAAGLTHRELVYHLSANYGFTLGSSTLVTLSIGPSFFNASQEFVSAVEITELGYPFDEVDIAPGGLEEVSATGWGYNIGIDLAYFGLKNLGLFGSSDVLDHIGIGLLLRYSRSKPDVVLQGVQQQHALQVGSLHKLGGIRLVF